MTSDLKKEKSAQRNTGRGECLVKTEAETEGMHV